MLKVGLGERVWYGNLLPAGHSVVWTPVEARGFVFSTLVCTGPEANQTSFTLDTVAVFQGSSGWGMTMTTHPHLGVRLRMSRIVLVLCLCASCAILQGDRLPFDDDKVPHLCFVVWQYYRQMSTAVTFASIPWIFWLFV